MLRNTGGPVVDVVTDPVTLVLRCRGAYFTTGDVDRNGAADVVFHSFDYGGSYETSLFMLKGHGDGTVDAAAKKVLLPTSPFAASNTVLEDLDGDGDLDEERIGALVRDLDGEKYDVREEATPALLGVADVAEPLLKAALEKANSAEVRMRLRHILDNPPSGKLSDLKSDEDALIRLVALLEVLDTPEARPAVARLVQPNVSLAIRKAAADAVRRQKR
ncbi:MAG: hypothetical protein HYY18_14285 [Planctomycetes bacterium]|nr:hypothetical protein [Planctomycetota bacterium]